MRSLLARAKDLFDKLIRWDPEEGPEATRGRVLLLAGVVLLFLGIQMLPVFGFAFTRLGGVGLGLALILLGLADIGRGTETSPGGLNSGGLRLVGLVLLALSGALVMIDIYAEGGAFPVVFVLATLAALLSVYLAFLREGPPRERTLRAVDKLTGGPPRQS